MAMLPVGTERSQDFKGYIITRISENSLRDIATLYTAVYGQRQPDGYYHSKYNTAFTGKKFIGYIAYNSTLLPVAYYGLVPCHFEYVGKVVTAAQCADAMTHPAHRNKGLLFELYQRILSLCIEEGIKMIFGFPNENSHPISINKFEMVETGIMDRFEIRINSLRLLNRLSQVLWIRKLITKYRFAVIKKYLLPERGVPFYDDGRGFCKVRRDPDYLAYKQFTGSLVIKTGKAKIWLKITNDLLIGDLSLNGEKLDDVITSLKAIARRMVLKSIHFHVSTNTPLHSLFSQLYPALPSFPVVVKDLNSGLPLENIKFTFADIDIF